MLENNINLDKQKILITGVAGFIGANLASHLLITYPNISIIGIDNLNNYYDVSLKKFRLDQLIKKKNFEFIKIDISDKNTLSSVFTKYTPDIVINLAAQAGVRYSIENPDTYIESNIVGFFNILECCRHSYDNGNNGVKHLVYASSSSVYGSNKKIPYSIYDNVDSPVSLYAATKKADELLAHAYSKLYKIPSTGLRFFTVYGPAGRPDMAYFGFTDKLVNNKTIKIYNYGNCKRDFTYIDDIIEGVTRIIQHSPELNSSGVPYKIYNIGNSKPENLLDFVKILYTELKEAKILPANYDFDAHKELVPMQPGDVEETYADVSELEQDFSFKPQTPLKQGLHKFVMWYKDYYHK